MFWVALKVVLRILLVYLIICSVVTAVLLVLSLYVDVCGKTFGWALFIGCWVMAIAGLILNAYLWWQLFLWLARKQ